MQLALRHPRCATGTSPQDSFGKYRGCAAGGKPPFAPSQKQSPGSNAQVCPLRNPRVATDSQRSKRRIGSTLLGYQEMRYDPICHPCFRPVPCYRGSGFSASVASVTQRSDRKRARRMWSWLSARWQPLRAQHGRPSIPQMCGRISPCWRTLHQVIGDLDRQSGISLRMQLASRRYHSRRGRGLDVTSPLRCSGLRA